MNTEHKVIAIDGPAGAGKSTVAKRLAEILGYSYLDTGAMYRAVTLKALRDKTPLEDEAALVDLAKQTRLELKNADGKNRVIMDGKDVTEDIRTIEVTNHSHYIARARDVREVLVQWQREMSERQDIVVEGRDVGTVVFPQATFKFFLDADLKERSRRRVKELEDKGLKIDAQRLSREIEERDRKDSTREASPLKKADDAVVIDSTRLTIEEVVEKILEHIH